MLWYRLDEKKAVLFCICFCILLHQNWFFDPVSFSWSPSVTVMFHSTVDSTDAVSWWNFSSSSLLRLFFSFHSIPYHRIESALVEDGVSLLLHSVNIPIVNVSGRYSLVGSVFSCPVSKYGLANTQFVEKRSNLSASPSPLSENRSLWSCSPPSSLSHRGKRRKKCNPRTTQEKIAQTQSLATHPHTSMKDFFFHQASERGPHWGRERELAREERETERQGDRGVWKSIVVFSEKSCRGKRRVYIQILLKFSTSNQNHHVCCRSYEGCYSICPSMLLRQQLKTKEKSDENETRKKCCRNHRIEEIDRKFISKVKYICQLNRLERDLVWICTTVPQTGEKIDKRPISQ